MASTILAGLQRAAVKTCSRWAETYRMMKDPQGPWSFKYHPWLLEMHNSEADVIIGQKAAQMGYTECAINLAFYSMDVKGQDVLYVLPTTSDASDFSSGRFDPALELSPYLQSFFADVNNVGLKRAAANMLYVRGSRSRSKLKSIPTPVLILDELDEMPKESIELAKERQSGQRETKTFMLSTPTLEGKGINEAFTLSNEKYYYFKCPKCSRFTNLIFPDCLVVNGDKLTDPALKTSYLKCKECDGKLDHETKVDWLKHRDRGGNAHFVASNPTHDADGFHVSQLYSMMKAGRPFELALAAMKAEFDPTNAQEWWNSKLGLPFTAKGAKLSDEEFDSCIRDFLKGHLHFENVRTMGVDVGSVLHIVVKEFKQEGWVPGLSLNDQYTARIVYEGTSTGEPDDFNEAFQIFHDLKASACVVDGEPERRMATQFINRLQGRGLLCDYIYSQRGRDVDASEDAFLLRVNRTSWLDLTLGRYRNGTVELPKDVSEMFRKQIKEPVRVYREDKFGQPYAVYVNEKDDHFAHADNYAEIALPHAVGVGSSVPLFGMY